jgi:hypothetical protein
MAGNDPIEKQSARENPLARKHHTWKNSLWSAVGKICYAAASHKNAPCSGTALSTQNAGQSNADLANANQANAGAGEGI